MASYNRVILMGNLTRDPELKSGDGWSVCKFSLAVNRKFKGRDGDQKEEVYFADCEAWNRVGEIVDQYCHRGSPLLVDGRLKRDEWEDKEGNKRHATRIVVETVQLVGGREADKKQPAEEHERPAPTGDEIPF